MHKSREELRQRLDADAKRAAGSPLPPPLAPTARDANPWPMPRQQGTPWPPKLRPSRPVTVPTPVPAPVPRSAPPTAGQPPHSRKRTRVLPLAVLAAAAAVLLSGALQAIGRGELGAALPLLLILGVLLTIGWRSRRRP